MEEQIQKAMSVKSDSPIKAERVLGSIGKVEQFGNFFMNNGVELLTVEASLLIRFSSIEDYTKEEFIAYRKGLQDMINFFKMCHTKEERKK
jgi:hypothetical protein